MRANNVVEVVAPNHENCSRRILQTPKLSTLDRACCLRCCGPGMLRTGGRTRGAAPCS